MEHTEQEVVTPAEVQPEADAPVEQTAPTEAEAPAAQPEVTPEVTPEPEAPAVVADEPAARADLGKVFEQNGKHYIRTTDEQGNIVDTQIPAQSVQK